MERAVINQEGLTEYEQIKHLGIDGCKTRVGEELLGYIRSALRWNTCVQSFPIMTQEQLETDQ